MFKQVFLGAAAAAGALLVAGQAGAAQVVVNSTINLATSSSGPGFVVADSSDITPALTAFSFGNGDQLVWNGDFQGDQALTVTNLSEVDAFFLISSGLGNNVTFDGTMKLFGADGSLVFQTSRVDTNGSAHIGQFFSGLSGVPSVTFSSFQYVGTQLSASSNPTRTYTAAVFRTFGSTVAVTSIPQTSAAPEPATWAMMIGGFMGAGAMLRRRNLAARAA